MFIGGWQLATNRFYSLYVSMGSACCVAARDRTVTNGSTSEILQRNVRYSPSWNFPWDNRGRVAGEDTSLNWSSDGISGNDIFDFKSRTTVETVYASEEGSPLHSFRSLAWQKSPTSERNGGSMSQPSSGILYGCPFIFPWRIRRWHCKRVISQKNIHCSIRTLKSQIQLRKSESWGLSFHSLEL